MDKQDKKVEIGAGINLGDGKEESKTKNRPQDEKGKVLEGAERPQDEDGNVLEAKVEDEKDVEAKDVDDVKENADTDKEDEDKEDIKEGVSFPVTRTGLISAFSIVEGASEKDVDNFKKLKDDKAKDVFATASKKGIEEAKSLMDSFREDEQPDVKTEKQKAEKVKKKEDLPIQEHLTAIFQGETLTEDFKSNAKTLFESAINARIIEEVAIIEEEASKEVEKRIEEATANLSESVDKYLSYVAEEWKEENRLALESGFKVEVTEESGTAMKGLLETFNVEIPTEKEDLYALALKENEELEATNSKLIDGTISLKEELNTVNRATIIKELAEDLADTEVEKLEKLTESVVYDDNFSKNVNIIKENYFPKGKTVESRDNEADALTEEVLDDSEANPVADAYTAWVAKQNENKV